ncbi:peroxisome assembly protein 22 [[Candida] anglica]|uniref:Peroxisome assembly protein 22 n=1 Tax=[Candida] anglica TaxID=148631 RepID=A0ABP0EBP7_9ASCO
MSQLRKIQKNPKAWLVAAIATSVIAVSVSVYNAYTTQDEPVEDSITSQERPVISRKQSRKYTNKSIALTLSHSILSSQLPLNEILLNSENVTFILPPNLSIDDLEYNIARGESSSSSSSTTSSVGLPKTMTANYKLLNCSNIQGYFNLLKNLKPDMLLVCSDDLGISKYIPHDIDKFVKEIVTLDQNKDQLYKQLSPLFFR